MRSQESGVIIKERKLQSPRRAPPPLSPFARLGTEKLLYIAPGFHFRPPVHFPLGMAAAIVRAALLRPFVPPVAPSYFHPGPARWQFRYICCSRLPPPHSSSDLLCHHHHYLHCPILTLHSATAPHHMLTHQRSLPCCCSCSSSFLLLCCCFLFLAMSNPRSLSRSNVAGSFSYAITGLALVEMMPSPSKFQFLCLMLCDAMWLRFIGLVFCALVSASGCEREPCRSGRVRSWSDERAPVLVLSVSFFVRCRLVWIYCYWDFFARLFPLLWEYSAAASNCSDSCGLTFIVLTLCWIVSGACFDRSFPPPDSSDVHLIIRIPLSSCDPSSWASCRESDTSMNEKLSSVWILLNFDWVKAEAELDDQEGVRSIAVVTSIQ